MLYLINVAVENEMKGFSSRASQKDRPGEMMTFLPCKHFPAPSSDMKKPINGPVLP